MKSLVIGYNHTFNDKRVMRTVKALRKLGTVYYQYAGDFVNDFEDIVSIPLKKPNAKKRIKYYKQRREFDKEILKLVKTLDYDLAYFHYFPASMPLGIFKAVKERGKTLIYELHEIIPIQFLPERYKSLSFIMWQIFKQQLLLSDAIACASEEALKFMLTKTRVLSKPFFILPNYASIKLLPEPRSKRRKEIVYVGRAQRSTNSEKAFLMELKNRGFTLKSIGMNWNIADISLPFLPYPEMMKEVARSAFSLISFQSRKDINYSNDIYSLPNKLFDSVAAGTPVIVNSRFKSMASLVERYNVGTVIDTTQSICSITTKIIKAWNDYETFLDAIQTNAEHFIWNEKKEQEFIDFVLGVIK
ncbi:glycosyltransferase [Kosmotoga pacifica]|uniref:Glycosyltransferase subfamily 4-like N-terminal domain-containing protein n=1 Tax=Kosmotoga pacifica TaxID=1330330 RepID=A0A0G2Z4I8_9BACT|nr:hypothetical protein [Kosmotoga pacifica]AKI96525.1 hypothetical protein IX53_00330 [Kosmotoga pacifica]